MRKTKYFLKSDILEAVTQSSSTKKVFLKISQNSPENNCAGAFSNKVSGWKLATFFKERLQRIYFSCECWEIFLINNLGQNVKEKFTKLSIFLIIFFIYSWLELLHFFIIVSIYIMMVNSVLHWKWKANWRQLNCNDIYIKVWFLLHIKMWFLLPK